MLLNRNNFIVNINVNENLNKHHNEKRISIVIIFV